MNECKKNILHKLERGKKLCNIVVEHTNEGKKVPLNVVNVLTNIKISIVEDLQQKEILESLGYIEYYFTVEYVKSLDDMLENVKKMNEAIELRDLLDSIKEGN